VDTTERIAALLSTINGGSLITATTGRCQSCEALVWEQDVNLISERAEIHQVEHDPDCPLPAAQAELERLVGELGWKITRRGYIFPGEHRGVILLGVVPPPEG
jgi:hypothetical protein